MNKCVVFFNDTEGCDTQPGYLKKIFTSRVMRLLRRVSALPLQLFPCSLKRQIPAGHNRDSTTSRTVLPVRNSNRGEALTGKRFWRTQSFPFFWWHDTQRR